MKKITYRQGILLITYAALLFAALMNITTVMHAANFVFATVQPLVIGVILALSMDCLVCRFELKVFTRLRPRTARVLSVAVSAALVVGAVVALLWFSLPDIIKSIGRIIENMPQYIDTAFRYIDSAAKNLGIKTPISDSLLGDGAGIAGTIAGSMSRVVDAVSAVAGGFVKILLGFVFSIYVLLDKKRIKSMIRRLLDFFFSRETGRRIYGYIELSAVTFKSFISGQVIESMVLGGLCFVGMVVIGLPYASIISVLIGVTGIIPMLGAYIGAVPSVLLLLLENPVQALIFIVFLVTLQQFENSVIYPKVVGNAIGIDGLFVFIGATLGAGLGGVIGLLVGVPLVAVLYATVGRMIRTREKLAAGRARPPEKETKG